MDEKKCACKGIRTCLACERIANAANGISTELQKYIYCDLCKTAWLEDPSAKSCEQHSGPCIRFLGIDLILNFVTEKEEAELCQEIDRTPWRDSQSGRRKQDYGPTVNFKKKKIKTSVFTGLPTFSKKLLDRMNGHNVLKDFIAVELCNLDYSPERGSAIDAHYDDTWLWGERLVTLNMLSETEHTMTLDSLPGVEVAVRLPRRSLVVASGPARHQWKHAIKRSSITARRVGVTFRELAAEFMNGGQNEDLGQEVKDVALTFNGVAVGQTPLVEHCKT